MTKIEGQLEIDHERGVVYFHANDTGWTVLRICQLLQIPKNVHFIDVVASSGTYILKETQQHNENKTNTTSTTKTKQKKTKRSADRKDPKAL